MSKASRAQASAIGAAIQRLDLKVGQIAASPVFRAQDTAELVFGAERVEIDSWLIGQVIPIFIATSSKVSRANFPEGAAAVFSLIINNFGWLIFSTVAGRRSTEGLRVQ